MPPTHRGSDGASEEERGVRPAPPASSSWLRARAKLAAGALLAYVALTYVVAVARMAPPPATAEAAADVDDDSDAVTAAGAAVPRPPAPYRAPTAPAVLLAAAGLAPAGHAADTDAAAASATVLASVMTFLPRDGHPPPAACAATRGGARMAAGERPFDALLLVNVDSRMSRQLHGPLEACAAGVCVGTWRPLAAAGAHVLLLGDEEVTGVVRRKWHFTIKNEEVHGLLTREAAAVGGLASPGAASTLVVVLDGTDVLLQVPPRQLIDRFNARYCERGWDTRRDVLFTGERALWPNFEPYSGFFNASFYAAHMGLAADYPFLNAGAYGGSWAGVAALLERTLPYAAAGLTDDQGIWHMLEAGVAPNGSHGGPGARAREIRIDDGGCQMLLGSAYVGEGAPTRGVYDFTAGAPNTLSQSYWGAHCAPALLHFNGPAKCRALNPALLRLPTHSMPAVAFWERQQAAVAGIASEPESRVLWYRGSLAQSPPAVTMSDLCLKRVGVPALRPPPAPAAAAAAAGGSGSGGRGSTSGTVK